MEQRPVIILIKLAAHPVVPIQQAIVLVALITLAMAVAEVVKDVNLVARTLLMYLVLTAVKPIVLVVLPAKLVNLQTLVLQDTLMKEQIITGVMLAGNFLKMYILLILMNIV